MKVFFAENYATNILNPPENRARPTTTAWEDATDGTANTNGTAIERADGTAKTSVNYQVITH